MKPALYNSFCRNVHVDSSWIALLSDVFFSRDLLLLSFLCFELGGGDCLGVDDGVVSPNNDVRLLFFDF